MNTLPKLTITPNPKADHRLILLPAGKRLPAALPECNFWQRLLKRKDTKAEELAKSPLAADLPDGTRATLVMVDAEKPRFEQLTALRKAAMPLLDETPKTLDILPIGIDDATLGDALYVVLVNAVPLPQQKKKPGQPLKEITLPCRPASADFHMALARANLLARELTALPPNLLDPAHYRQRLRALAKERKFAIEEFDFRKLKKLGAGAFCAVAQGSDDDGGKAAIVRLSWRPKKAVKTIALVGKGICYDTGGHNLKPAKYMAGMHEDMNGSAVALGLMQALIERNMPLAIDAWLPIAQNHLSPEAYKQNDIVTALDGTTIEVVHTDAEGRMVLADTLTLASRGAGNKSSKANARPDLVIDFATLTGSMGYALGSRYSGVFATSSELARLAVAAGEASGERVCVFPLDADYEAGLESKMADIKQCTLDGEADHILAARFLKRFTNDLAWVHMDLSASSCSGGLGAVGTDLTGFGVAWGVEFVEQWLAAHAASPAPHR